MRRVRMKREWKEGRGGREEGKGGRKEEREGEEGG